MKENKMSTKPVPSIPQQGDPLPTDHQELMNIFYNYWQALNAQIREQNKQESDRAEATGEEAVLVKQPSQADIFCIMPSKVNAAVVLGNFNYQVCNGGFLQWDDNGYSSNITHLKRLFEGATKIGIENADKVLDLIERFEKIKEEAREPVRYSGYNYQDPDDETEHDFEEESYPDYDDLDTEYYKIDGEPMMQKILDRYNEVIEASFFSW